MSKSYEELKEESDRLKKEVNIAGIKYTATVVVIFLPIVLVRLALWATVTMLSLLTEAVALLNKGTAALLVRTSNKFFITKRLGDKLIEVNKRWVHAEVNVKAYQKLRRDFPSDSPNDEKEQDV